MTPTVRQKQLIDTIRMLSARGVAPSYEELASALNLRSRGSLSLLLKRARERGLLTYERGRARSLRVVDAPDLEAMATDDLRGLRDRVDAILRARAAAPIGEVP